VLGREQRHHRSNHSVNARSAAPSRYASSQGLQAATLEYCWKSHQPVLSTLSICPRALRRHSQDSLTSSQWSFIAAASRLRDVQAATKRRFKVGVGRLPGRRPKVLYFVECETLGRLSEVPSKWLCRWIPGNHTLLIVPVCSTIQGGLGILVRSPRHAWQRSHDRHRPSHLNRHGPPSRTRRPGCFISDSTSSPSVPRLRKKPQRVRACSAHKIKLKARYRGILQCKWWSSGSRFCWAQIGGLPDCARGSQREAFAQVSCVWKCRCCTCTLPHARLSWNQGSGTVADTGDRFFSPFQASLRARLRLVSAEPSSYSGSFADDLALCTCYLSPALEKEARFSSILLLLLAGASDMS
jgi:hypothetical protein